VRGAKRDKCRRSLCSVVWDAEQAQQRRHAKERALHADDQEVSRCWKMISNLAQRFTKLSNPMNQTDWSNQMSANRALRNGTSFSQGAGQGALMSSPLNFY